VSPHASWSDYVIEPPDILRLKGPEDIRGEHLVRPDGTINLGSHGSVSVAGLTVPEAARAVAKHLERSLGRVRVTLDVVASNSKVYYVVYDGGGYGMQVYRLPITGNETVLDAIAQVDGLALKASRCRVWIRRPEKGGAQMLPVDWKAITHDGCFETNYPLQPGDSIHINPEPRTFTKHPHPLSSAEQFVQDCLAVTRSVEDFLVRIQAILSKGQ
jgi:polysaccharide export outer membrane protein